MIVMKRVITLFAVLLMGWSVNAWSFACKTANGTAIPIGGGSANVYVNLAPAVNVGQNLVVDLSTQIFCHNDYPETITDYVTLQRGSAYGGVLSSFSGTVKYNGSSYPFPTTSETPRVVYNSRTDKPWPVALYLTPVSSAGGVAIKAGSLIAVLILRQTNNYNSDDFQFVWNIYANNDVVSAMTAAGIISAAILDPATGQLVGVNPALLVLATAAGSNTLTHINDASFWLFKGYFDLSVKDTLKTWGLLELVNSVVGLIMVLIISMVA
jgi:hypothetical protein